MVWLDIWNYQFSILVSKWCTFVLEQWKFGPWRNRWSTDSRTWIIAIARLLDSLWALFWGVGIPRGACKFGVLHALLLKLRKIKFAQIHLSFISFGVNDWKFSFVMHLVCSLSFASTEDNLRSIKNNTFASWVDSSNHRPRCVNWLIIVLTSGTNFLK